MKVRSFDEKYFYGVKTLKTDKTEPAKSSIFTSTPIGNNQKPKDNEPTPSAIKSAEEIMNCLRRGDAKGLKKAIQNMAANDVFEVLKICYQQNTVNGINKHIFESGAGGTLTAKILENISNRTDLPAENKAYISIKFAYDTEQGAGNVYGSKQYNFSTAVNEVQDFLDGKLDERMQKDLNTLKNGGIVEFKYSRIQDLQRQYGVILDEYNKKYKTNIKDIFAPQEVQNSSPIQQTNNTERVENEDDPEKTAQKSANDIIKYLSLGQRDNLRKTIKDIKPTQMWEVLQLCYSKYPEHYINEQIFKSKLSNLVQAKLAETISYMDDVSPLYKLVSIKQIMYNNSFGDVYSAKRKNVERSVDNTLETFLVHIDFAKKVFNKDPKITEGITECQHEFLVEYGSKETITRDAYHLYGDCFDRWAIIYLVKDLAIQNEWIDLINEKYGTQIKHLED